MPERSPVPLACTGEPARIDLLLFVHRVQGLEPGLYWLGRSGRAAGGLREDYLWQALEESGLPLYRLLSGDARGLSAFLSCGQDIASDGCVAFAMLADAMERDSTLRQAFFKNLRGMGYGGATLSDDLYDRMQALAIAERTS